MTSRGTLVTMSSYEGAVRKAARKYDAEAMWRICNGTTERPKNTRRIYRQCFREWFDYCRDNELDVLDPPFGADQAFLDHLFLNGLKPTTVRLRAVVIRYMYDRLDELRVVKRPFASVDEAGASAAKPVYSEQDVQKLLRHADDPDRVVILWHTDMRQRIHKLLDLTWEDIADGYVVVDGTRVPIPRRLLQAFHKLPRERDRIMPFGSQWWAYSRLRDLAEDVGVEWRGMDVLRRSPRVYDPGGVLA